MVPFYSTIQKFIDSTGLVVQPWIAYLQQFTIAPPPFMDIDVNLGSGTLIYEAEEPGFLYIFNDASVGNITLTRGKVSIIAATSLAQPRFIPVAIKDVVSFNYSSGPTVKFIPSYGQNTTS